VYIGNRPNYQDLPFIDHVKALKKGEVEAINRECGNGWRKVFNVYAKLVYAWRSADASLDAHLPGAQCESWQAYRDQVLLQAASQTSLLFTPLPLSLGAGVSPPLAAADAYHIIMGRTYAKSLLVQENECKRLNFNWLDSEFAIDRQARTLVCPYFDYRQLSNIKIIRLVELLMTLNKS
jgi:hypothetical protein